MHYKVLQAWNNGGKVDDIAKRYAISMSVVMAIVLAVKELKLLDV